MITPDLERRIDDLWDGLVSAGLDAWQVLDQVGFLVFLRLLDARHADAESKARAARGLMDSVIFLPGQRHLRWPSLAGLPDPELYAVMGRDVFGFLRGLGGDGSTYSDHMTGARLQIPTPDLLRAAMEVVDRIPLEDRESSGAAYDHLLAHLPGDVLPTRVVRLMVDLAAPGADDEVCDPGCADGRLLVAAGDFVRSHHPTALTDAAQQRHPGGSMVHGFADDVTRRRVASMNLLLHGIAAPDIRSGQPDPGSASVVLADLVDSPGLLGALPGLLAPGGRAVVAVPEAFLSAEPHREARESLVGSERLEAVIQLPTGPLLAFVRGTPSDGDEVWCFDADDDDLPDVAARWARRTTSERARTRLDRSFTVARADVVEHGFDLALHRYE